MEGEEKRAEKRIKKIKKRENKQGRIYKEEERIQKWCKEERKRVKEEEEERIKAIRTEEEAWKYIYINRYRKKRGNRRKHRYEELEPAFHGITWRNKRKSNPEGRGRGRGGDERERGGDNGGRGDKIIEKIEKGKGTGREWKRK